MSPQWPSGWWIIPALFGTFALTAALIALM
jgi:hypothetical protein